MHACLILVKYNHFFAWKEYLTTDGGNVSIFLEDGRKKATYTPEETMDTIIYCSHSNQFVGYTKGDDELFVSGYIW